MLTGERFEIVELPQQDVAIGDGRLCVFVCQRQCEIAKFLFQFFAKFLTEGVEPTTNHLRGIVLKYLADFLDRQALTRSLGQYLYGDGDHVCRDHFHDLVDDLVDGRRRQRSQGRATS